MIRCCAGTVTLADVAAAMHDPAGILPKTEPDEVALCCTECATVLVTGPREEVWALL